MTCVRMKYVFRFSKDLGVVLKNRTRNATIVISGCVLYNEFVFIRERKRETETEKKSTEKEVDAHRREGNTYFFSLRAVTIRNSCKYHHFSKFP